MRQLLLAFSLILATQFGCLTLRENLFEGSTADKAIAMCKQKIAGSTQILRIEITQDTATIRARNPNKPDEVDDYLYAHGVCKGPEPVVLNNLERAMSSDRWIFSLDEVNVAATPTVIKEALARVNLEGGKVTGIKISRDIPTGPNESIDDLVIRWTIDIKGTRESASARANSKGEIIGVDLSGTSRAAKLNYIDPRTLQDAVSKVKKEFGGRVTLLEMTIYDSYIWFKAIAPTSAEVNQYQYDINGVVNKGAASVMPLPKGEKTEDRYFQIDDVDFSATEQVLKSAFVKADAKQPGISFMQIKMQHPNVFSNKFQIFWSVVVLDGPLSAGRNVVVNFNAQGGLIPQ